MIITDTHTHLYSEAFDEDRDEIMQRALDAGAHGITVPQVNTPDDARRAVASAYYPPRGNRGAGLFRAQGYSDDFESYRRWAETEITVFVQI